MGLRNRVFRHKVTGKLSNQTISALRDCQEAYYKKSKGDKLDWSTASRLEDLYKRSIDDYKEVGLQLNDLSYIIF